MIAAILVVVVTAAIISVLNYRNVATKNFFVI